MPGRIPRLVMGAQIGANIVVAAHVTRGVRTATKTHSLDYYRWLPFQAAFLVITDQVQCNLLFDFLRHSIDSFEQTPCVEVEVNFLHVWVLLLSLIYVVQPREMKL